MPTRMVDIYPENATPQVLSQQSSDVNPLSNTNKTGPNLLEIFGLVDHLYNRMVIEQEEEEVNIILFHNGNTYEGDILNGCLHGTGKFTWKDSGTTYTGQFFTNQLTGIGRMEWSDGSYYEGGFLRGKRHGTGTYYHPSGITYIGEWLNGKKHGKGRLEYTSDGACFYEGDWFEDTRQGHGIAQYPDGTTYEGEWVDGKRCGEGTMHWKDRDEIYSGEWIDGQQNGQGSHAWHIYRVRTTQYSLPNVYDGQWKDGKRHGFGVFHYPNGSKYAGFWKDNMKHGKGTLILKDGRMFQRIFKEDCIVERPVHEIEQPGLERLDTRMPLFPEILPTPHRVEPMLSDTSDSNLLEHLLRPHLSDEHCAEEELRAMQNCIRTHLSALRCIYQFYGRLGLETIPDNTIVMKHIQLCQFIKDCRLHQHTSLAVLDRIMSIIYAALTEEADHTQRPDNLITFCAFVNILALLACNLCTQAQLFLHRTMLERGKPSEALSFLLTDAILPNACKITGPLYENSRKTREILAFKEPSFHVYQFLTHFYNKSTSSKSTIRMRQFLFMLRDYKLLDEDLCAKDVVGILCTNNPAAGPPTQCNMDVELTFFDFFEALVQCATHVRPNEPVVEEPPPCAEETESPESTPKDIAAPPATRKEMIKPARKQSMRYAPPSPMGARRTKERRQRTREGSKASVQSSVTEEPKQATLPAPEEDSLSELPPIQAEERTLTPSVPEMEEVDEFQEWKTRLERFFLQRLLPVAQEMKTVQERIWEAQGE